MNIQVVYNQIEEDTKARRQDELLSLQQEVSLDNGEKKIGQVMDVLIEGYVADDNAYVGRTYGDAPGVDGYFFVNTEETLNSGDIVPARVTGALEYDLIGVIEDEFTE